MSAIAPGIDDVPALMRTGPVIPVIVVDDVGHARPLAEALVAGGIRVLEVTLRTPQALDAIRAMTDVDGAIVGVGTALDGDDLARARDAGATFAVSPGYTDALGARARASSTSRCCPASRRSADVMRARDGGYEALKFFPAGPAGGPTMLKALGGPFVDAVFCPTGGVSAANAREYLTLPNVLCVGGSWLAPKSMVRAGDWEGVTGLAREAVGLGGA